MSEKQITYFEKNGERFANVLTRENLTFTCRTSRMKNKGAAIILLHGFPETSRMWHKLIKVLDSKNYLVIAPDQRGYSSGARPSKIKDYKINKLTKDIIDIADAFKLTNFHLVGHDWGAAVGWVMSSMFKNRIISYSALSVPHLDAFSKAISNDKIQKKKSYYMILFRIRFLPELYFKIFNYHNLKILWRSSDDLEIKNYLSVFREKNALKSALHWYRATSLKSTRKIGDILVPTLLIYGKKDFAIGQKAVDETKKYLKSFHLIKTINYSHWLIQDSFDFVSKNILNHIETNK